MKAFLIATCCLTLATSTAVAQEKSLRAFRNKYRSAETHTLSLGSFPMRFASWYISFDKEDADSKAVSHALKHVKRLKMYTITNINGDTVNYDDIADLKSNLQRNDHFDLLMEVREKNSLVHVLNKGTDDELGNVVLLIQDDKQFVIVNLQTSLKMADVNSLIQQFAAN
ncbi:DUF4252 domain-containing protein [Chitinophaga sp. 30R24]|uniref:DUF4252 domain-containing protein n=1 Tax=Chitinophaga sp. 30R24 TaxID=3248838 RepID=UPI003B904F2F